MELPLSSRAGPATATPASGNGTHDPAAPPSRREPPSRRSHRTLVEAAVIMRALRTSAVLLEKTAPSSWGSRRRRPGGAHDNQVFHGAFDGALPEVELVSSPPPWPHAQEGPRDRFRSLVSSRGGHRLVHSSRSLPDILRAVSSTAATRSELPLRAAARTRIAPSFIMGFWGRWGPSSQPHDGLKVGAGLNTDTGEYGLLAAELQGQTQRCHLGMDCMVISCRCHRPNRPGVSPQ